MRAPCTPPPQRCTPWDLHCTCLCCLLHACMRLRLQPARRMIGLHASASPPRTNRAGRGGERRITLDLRSRPTPCIICTQSACIACQCIQQCLLRMQRAAAWQCSACQPSTIPPVQHHPMARNVTSNSGVMQRLGDQHDKHRVRSQHAVPLAALHASAAALEGKSFAMAAPQRYVHLRFLHISTFSAAEQAGSSTRPLRHMVPRTSRM